jgi:hypothetical protein
MPRTKKLFYLEDPTNSLTGDKYEDILLYKVVNANPSDYKPLDDYKVLYDHIKAGGSLRNSSYFYDNILKVAGYRHGEGYKLIYTYCRNVLKGRLPEDVEKKLYGDTTNIWNKYRGGSFAYKYAKYVVRKRLPVPYEKGCCNYDYIMFLKRLKEDFTGILISHSGLAYAFYKYNHYLPEDAHNAMIAKSMLKDHQARIYFKVRKKDDKLIKNRLKVMDQTKTISEIISSLG